MGDWAEAAFEEAGKKAPADYVYLPAPGTDGVFDFLADSFTLPVGAPHPAGAKAWLKTVGSLDGQVAFNKAKGSIPARKDAKPGGLLGVPADGHRVVRQGHDRVLAGARCGVPVATLNAISGRTDEQVHHRWRPTSRSSSPTSPRPAASDPTLVAVRPVPALVTQGRGGAASRAPPAFPPVLLVRSHRPREALVPRNIRKWGPPLLLISPSPDPARGVRLRPARDQREHLAQGHPHRCPDHRARAREASSGCRTTPTCSRPTEFQHSLRNLVIYTVVFLVGTMLFGFLWAWLLDRPVKFEGVFRSIYLFPMAVSFVASGVVWRWLLNSNQGESASGLNRLFQMIGLPFLQNNWWNNVNSASRRSRSPRSGSCPATSWRCSWPASGASPRSCARPLRSTARPTGRCTAT